MKIFLQTAAFSILFSAVVFSQASPVAVDSDQYAASISWLRYKFSDGRASVMLPKLPVLVSGAGGDSCREITGNSYFAYTDETVYEFRYVLKAAKPPEDWCEKKIFFGQKALEDRLSSMPGFTDYKETEMILGGRKIKVYRSETPHERWVRWIIPDFSNNRWLELAMSSRLDKKPDEKRFLDSLDLYGKDGVEVTDGSSTTLGDIGVVSAPATPGTLPATSNGLVLKAKPRPGYTESARQNNFEGTVT